MAMILMGAIIPNSFNTVCQNNVAKPEAVVRLVISVALPIFIITLCKDLTMFPCLQILLVFVDQKYSWVLQ